MLCFRSADGNNGVRCGISEPNGDETDQTNSFSHCSGFLSMLADKPDYVNVCRCSEDVLSERQMAGCNCEACEQVSQVETGVIW